MNLIDRPNLSCNFCEINKGSSIYDVIIFFLTFWVPFPFCLLSELKIRKNCAFLHVHVNNFRLHFFRKPINSADIHTDSNFESIITLIWAYGQHDHSFYVDDVLKYHGRNKGVRGKLLFVHLFVCSLICLFICSFIHSFIHSFIQSFIHSFNFQICKESLLQSLDSNPFLSS